MKLPKPVRVLLELFWFALFTTTMLRILAKTAPLSLWDLACIAVLIAGSVMSCSDAVKHIKGRP